MVLALLPNSELVGVAFIGTITGLSPGMVATTLPADDQAWSGTGFVTVAVVGGSPHPDLAVRNPVMQVDCWAVKPGSGKPPWWKANAIAETIRNAAIQRTGVNRLLAITANGVTYPSAVVQAAWLVTEPRRRYADAADYALYSMDVAMTWTVPSAKIA